jgi:hypothetical protein
MVQVYEIDVVAFYAIQANGKKVKDIKILMGGKGKRERFKRKG